VFFDPSLALEKKNDIMEGDLVYAVTRKGALQKITNARGPLDTMLRKLEAPGTAAAIVLRKADDEMRLIGLQGAGGRFTLKKARALAESIEAVSRENGAKRVVARTWIFAETPELMRALGFKPKNAVEAKNHEEAAKRFAANAVLRRHVRHNVSRVPVGQWVEYSREVQQ